MNILLSAYACEPGKGSEPEVGLQVLVAAASQHEVCVLTRENNIPALKKWLEDQPFRSRVRLEGFDLPGLKAGIKKWGLPGLHFYYDAWQRSARRRAVELDAEVDFDLMHHATFATYWARAGVAGLGKPFVWGPIGGAVELPWRLIPELGLVGIAEDTVRYGARAVLGRSPWIVGAAQTADVILVQNQEAALALSSSPAELSILPNATSIEVGPAALEGIQSRDRNVLFVGRLVAWKGASLAVRALGRMKNDALLRIYGDGPDADRVRRLARRLGIENRVQFMGRASRKDLLAAVAAAGCVVHPALHDDSPLGVAETLSLGTPLVCLDHGGPAELARHWSDSPASLIRPGSLDSTVAALASAIDVYLDHPPIPPAHVLKPNLSFHEEILKAYEVAIRHHRNR